MRQRGWCSGLRWAWKRSRNLPNLEGISTEAQKLVAGVESRWFDNKNQYEILKLILYISRMLQSFAANHHSV